VLRFTRTVLWHDGCRLLTVFVPPAADASTAMRAAAGLLLRDSRVNACRARGTPESAALLCERVAIARGDGLVLKASDVIVKRHGVPIRPAGDKRRPICRRRRTRRASAGELLQKRRERVTISAFCGDERQDAAFTGANSVSGQHGDPVATSSSSYASTSHGHNDTFDRHAGSITYGVYRCVCPTHSSFVPESACV